MKIYISLCLISLLSISCNSQNKNLENTEAKYDNQKIIQEPKGSWKVDKEFDENGNLIRYDSIYSWSSQDKYNKLSISQRDSLIQSFKSKFFTNFLELKNQGFEDIFANDSLVSNYFFNDSFFESNFGSDFMDINNIKKQLIARQKEFLKKHQFKLIKPEDEMN
ncbi:hypothetical protein [Oceanihabitans sediminis]|uniref:hypothetical protein n=1 Tax=Oceanihabitans sediminis TaxID=1812012 RepID=UPI00299D4645|nr:hypothetical protein [Oceanihabitans sediminis]MDX1279005.1 hypothetical protein [Oceanihabitans sediminis]